jgi:hypothetical protein
VRFFLPVAVHHVDHSQKNGWRATRSKYLVIAIW